MTSPESVAAATETIHRSKKNNEKAVQTRLRQFRSQLSTTIGTSFSESTFKSTLSTAPASLPSSCSPSSGSTSLRRSARLRSQIPVPVVEVHSNDYVETQHISRMIIRESDGKNNETVRPRKKRKVTREEQGKTRAQALGPQKSLPSPSALEADVSDKYCLRE